MSSDFDIKSQLLIAVENWLNDISFFAADEPNGTTERMVAWQNLERVLFSLDKTLIHLLVLKQRQMIDTLVQHISGSAYSANRDVWFLAAKCLRACYQALHSNLWDNGEFCAIDLMFYLMGVVEKIIDERAGEDGFKYVVQAMDLWGAVLASESSTEEIYASFVGCLSQLILQSASGSFYKKKLASFLQSYIFSLAAAARTELLCTLFSTDSWDSAAGAVPGTETGTGSVATARLPIGGSDQLLVTLCTNRSITQHPLIALSIIRCHASLACVPVLRYGQSSSTHASWQVAGLLQQDTIITDFLVHLQLCLVDGSLSLAVPPTFRATLVESLCPLVCAPNASLCCAARRLMHIVATDRQDLVELTASASSTATVSMRQVFPDQASVVRTGAAVMNGVRQVLEDLSGDRLLGDNKPSEELCAAVDEILELFLECVVTRALVGDASLGEVAGKLSETLLFCSKVVRPKLAPSLHMLLQKGANCSIRGCLQLLEANARFLGAQRVSAIPSIPPPQSHPASASAAPASVGFVAHTMASAARNAVTSRREIIDLTSSSAPSKDSWDFLKPAAVPTHKPPAVPSGPFSKQTTKAPSGPFSKLDNSITRAERSAGQSSNSSNSSNKESVLDRMAREEQEQLERDRKNLFRKRIFGDLDANPPPNSDDLTGSVGKHAKLSSEFGAHVSWLSAKAPTAKEQETSWEQQIRELREAKEQARRLAEQKASSAAGSGERVHNWGGEEATANAGACAGTGAAVSRPARIGRHRSALLDDNTGYDDDEDGAEAGEGPAAVSRKVVDWRTLLQMDKPSAAVQNATASSAAAAASTVDVSGLMQMYTSGQMTAAAGKRGARPEVSFSEAMAAISIDPIVRMLLQCQLAELCAEARDGGQGRNSSSADSVELQPAPVRFLQEEHYIESFTPILLAEVKSAVASFINGENTSDEARYSSSGGPAGQAAASSEPLRVRCLLKTERPGQPKLQEAVVSPLLDEKHRGRLNKDDLVLVMTTGAHADTVSLRQFIGRPHALALVLTSATRGDVASGGSGSSSSSSIDAHGGRDDKENKRQQATLLMLAGSAPPQDTVRLVVPVMGLTSFLREWSALMSIRNHRLMPLAPYLLKASPVVSSQHLGSIHDAVVGKLKALEYNGDLIMSLDRQARLNAALLENLQQLRTLQVDGSVLKNTGVAKTVKSVSSATSKLIAPECEGLAAEIITRWKAQVKNDNRVSTIRNMKGGKLIEMPSAGDIERPRCVSPELWAHFLASYNKSQLFAIKYVSDQFEGGQDTRIALVQGPPGTGKTFTVLGMVAALLNYYSEGGSAAGDGATIQARKRLLICAPSNTAVDELLSRLSHGIADGSGGTRQLRIVRLGEPLEGASEAIKKLTLDTQIDERLRKDEAWVKLQSAKDAIARLDRELTTLPVSKFAPPINTNNSSAPPALSKEQQRARYLRTELASQRQVKVRAEMAVERARSALRQQILLEADVVGATLSGSGRKQFLDMALQHDVTFETAIVDEAAQATEPSCLIPLRLGCRRLVLVGDPRQLPATVLSKAAAKAGLGRSLFERLERADHEVVMLTIQYRMHPEIRRFPSKFFYQDLLTDAPEAQALQPLLIQQQGSSSRLAPVRFLDLRIANDTPAGKSFVNDAEISVITRLLCALLPHARTHSVAVITPYKAQVGRVKRALRDDTQLLALQNERRRNDAEIEVNSVDGFQGREKDIVIFSAVRSNMRHQHDALRTLLEPGEVDAAAEGRSGFSIGFVADERRLNVAVTRAKRLLIVVGNAGTLATDGTWRSMLQALGERQQVARVRRIDDLRSESAVFDLLFDRSAK